jgi:hypothetical protein
MANRVKLQENHSEKLQDLPENGMGYQLVDLTLKDGRVLKERVVLNSSYLQLGQNEELDPSEIEKVELHSG